MAHKVLSIIIPNYNDGNKIERCISSIIKQNNKKIEIIVVDDGSTDNSVNILKKYKDKIILRTQENRGTWEARNKGLKLAKGKYIWFVDADDMVLPNSLNSEFLNNLSNNKYDMYLFGAELIRLNGKNRVYVNEQDKTYNKSQFIRNFEQIFKTNLLKVLWNKLYLNDFLNRYSIKFHSLASGEDAMFNYEVIENLNKIKILKSIKYRYFLFTSSNSDYKKSKNLKIDTLVRLKKFDDVLNKFGIPLNNIVRNRDILDSLLALELTDFEKIDSLSDFYNFCNSKDIKYLKNQINLKNLNIHYLIKKIILSSSTLSYIYLKKRK